MCDGSTACTKVIVFYYFTTTFLKWMMWYGHQLFQQNHKENLIAPHLSTILLLAACKVKELLRCVFSWCNVSFSFFCKFEVLFWYWFKPFSHAAALETDARANMPELVNISGSSATGTRFNINYVLFQKLTYCTQDVSPILFFNVGGFGMVPGFRKILVTNWPSLSEWSTRLNPVPVRM